METVTTMVRFRFPKDKMTKRTKKAQLFECGLESSEKIWIPLKKMEVDANLSDTQNIVVMPRWLWMKTNLPLYSEEEEQFEVKTEISKQQLI